EAVDSIARAVGEVLALVGLAGHEQQFPAQLSGGEQQRVALARAIVIRPRVLLFDEPLSNLDAKLRVQMRSEIRALQRRLSITTIYVTHDQEEAMAVSDRIAVMNRGSVVQEGSAEDLYHRPASQFVAQFVGRINLISGRVLAVDGMSARIEALGREVVADVTKNNLKPGDPVQIALRPEAIDIAPGGGAHSLAGTVVSSVFLGDKVEYLVRCGDAHLQVAHYNPGRAMPVAAGTPVNIAFADNAVVVLRPSP